MANPWKTVILSDCLGMYDWSLSSKFFLNKGVSEILSFPHVLNREDKAVDPVRPSLPSPSPKSKLHAKFCLINLFTRFCDCHLYNFIITSL